MKIIFICIVHLRENCITKYALQLELYINKLLCFNNIINWRFTFIMSEHTDTLPDTEKGTMRHFLTETTLGRALVATTVVVGMSSLTACSNEGSSAADNINSEVNTTQASVPEIDYSQITIEQGEKLSEDERIAACRDILFDEYGYPKNVDMTPDTPAGEIISYHLAILSDAHRYEDARLLWCVYSDIDTEPDADGYITAYANNKNKIQDGNTIAISKGYTSVEEIGRDSAGNVEIRWTLEGTIHRQGIFRLSGGIYIADKIFNPEE